MVNLLIAEDEQIVRLGLQSKIDWPGIGVTLCHAAENGLEAKEYLELNNVDIVLTDIRMPEMDGIALAEWIKDNRPQTRVVLLTGYNEFSYAKSAVKSGVEDYLLKPVNKLEITRVIEAIANDIIHEKRRHEEQAQIEQMLADNISVIQNSFLTSLLHPLVNHDMAADYLRYFKMEHLIKGCSCVSIMDIGQNSTAQPREENKALLELIVKGTVLPPLQYTLFSDNRNRMVLLITGQDELDWDAMILMDETILEAANGRGIPLTIGVGGLYSGAGNIFRSYDEADQVMLHGYFYSRGTVIAYQGTSAAGIRRTQSRADASRSSQELKDAFARRDWLAVAAMLDATYRQMQSTHGDDSAANMQILGLFTNLFNLISEWEIDISLIFNQQDMVHILQQRNALDDVYGFLKDKYQKAFDVLHTVDKEQRMSITNAIKDYVEENYACDLTLDDIAGQVYMNRSYISSLFSRENGITLSNYIMTVRIQKAMKMMIEDPQEKLFSVSARVGYPDEKYFSRIFKRVTGQSPHQFKSNLRQNK